MIGSIFRSIGILILTLSITPALSHIDTTKSREFVQKVLAGPWTVKRLPCSWNQEGSASAPFLAGEGRTMFFTFRSKGGAQMIFMVTRHSTQDTIWSDPVPLRAFNGDRNAGTLSVDSVGDIFYASSANTNIENDVNIWQANPDSIKTNNRKLPEPVNTNAWDSQPFISYSGRTLLYVSTRGGVPTTQRMRTRIFATHSDSASVWSPPISLGASVNEGRQTMCPFLSEDEQILLFASNLRRVSSAELFITYKNGNTDSSWAPPVALPDAINTFQQMQCPFLSPSGEILYFIAPRGPKGLGTSIYEARMPGAVWRR